jgi:hypothetical protein
MTYPLQFAAGALINTAGSGNDFVGGTNGYGNVEFNGLPSLSVGYIVLHTRSRRSAMKLLSQIGQINRSPRPFIVLTVTPMEKAEYDGPRPPRDI